ncbi:LysR family transcriptional regulator [Neotabrizicola shimadae]|uniref:LysR family transcriptional regulator n=1 Tax=Neotabrizicola shimadae TaxID=2807096 RepID=A0A8G0ZPQ5_9RHOB|nr:LysR family transcriptional regulator [Neotabrizicola shimadae]QYZ69211.1 LysR family transcriptional regulator [Neotabrizicola shimadae]
MTNITSLDLNLLKALDALIDTRSVTLAAARLGLSQPAVSGMLARLRDVFGDPLFVRAQRGLLPTPRAIALAEPLRQTLSQIEGLVQPEAFDPATTEGMLRIAATDYAQAAVILPLLQVLRRIAPGLRVAVRPITSDFAADLASGSLDFALVTPDMAADTLRSRKLFEETYVCILRDGHPQADRLDLDAFCALDHAIMSHDGTQFRGATDLALDRIGRSRRVVATLPSFLVLLSLVRGSDAIALVPRRLTKAMEGIVVRQPPLPVMGFTKIAVWHERMQHDPAHAWVRERLAEIASEPGGQEFH